MVPGLRSAAQGKVSRRIDPFYGGLYADIMFNIGMPELLVILVIALLVIGPKKLPEIAKSIGRAIGEFQRSFDELKGTIEKEVKEEEEKAREQEKKESPLQKEERP